MPAVGMQRVGQDPAIGSSTLAFLRLEDDRAGAVTEQHAGAAVVPVEDAREGLRADHQGSRCKAVLDQAVGHRDAVDEAGTNRLDVEGRSAGHAQPGLDACGRGRKGFVGRRGREHDQVEVGGRHAGMGKRAFRRLQGEMRGELSLGGDVALADAGALPDPFV